MSSHFDIGSNTVTHRGKKVRTIVGNLEAQKTLETWNRLKTIDAYIPAGYEFRPDSIADILFGNVNQWWLVQLLSNKPDPFENLNIGERLSIFEE